MDERPGTQPTPEPTKPPTMEDVATRAGVSRALVSIVFRELPGASPANRERVKRAAAEIGFRPDRRASLLGRKRTNLLGVAFGVGHEFHAELIAALYVAAAEQGLEVVLSGITDDRSEEQAVTELLAFRCDALVLLGPTLGAEALETIAATTPVVTLASAVQAPGVEVVRTDDELGARLATDHLLGLGHRAIVHLDGRRAPGGPERRRGFLAAMRSAGLPDTAFLYPGGLTEEDGVAAARLYLAERAADRDQQGDPVPTAVFAFNDRCAIGFLATVRDAGLRVPADVSLVGYDDSRIARASWTRLTTVAQDIGVLARGAVARARTRIQPYPAQPPNPDPDPATNPNPDPATNPDTDDRAHGPLLVPPGLVIRDTASVPAAGRL